MGIAVTLAFCLGALYGLQRLQNRRWRLLAEDYASSVARPSRAVMRLATVVAIGGEWLFTKYVGVRIEVCDDGLALSMVPPFSVGARPLFLPFSEMKVRRTDWYLNSGSFALRMERGGGVELIVDAGVLSWIQAHTDKCELAA